MATNTYVALKTTTVTGSAVSSVTLDLSGITNYTDLVLVGRTQSDGGSFGNLSMRFNSDTTANYSRVIMYGNGSTAGSAKSGASTDTSIALNTMPYASQGHWATVQVNIMNYSNTTTFKTVLSRAGLLNDATLALVGLWRKTPEAITSINLFSTVGNINVGSTFTVYGIANDNNFVKATGGTITSDDSYFYHVYNATGSFIPKQPLTADILVIAGGGAGWPDAAGGGGAGGFLGYSSQSLTASTYTCTVGAGGSASGYTTSNGSNSQFGSLTASVGGGKGGYTGTSGGSGGGSRDGAPGSATSGQGYAGGQGTANSGGGGGGAGAVGVAASGNNGGNGGAGLNTYSSWATVTSTGVSGYYAGGGGGGPFTGATGGTGGVGGGGNGGNSPTSGAANTGSGGGGATAGNTNNAAGGSGIIIIRYPK